MKPEAPSLLTHTPESDLVFYLRDLCEFTETAEANPRMFTYIVFATFGAVQAGMIITLGKRWLFKPHQELKEDEKPQAKGFIRMFKDLQDHKNWDGFNGIGITTCTSWDHGVAAVKGLRDALEHPKYDGTNLSCSFIQGDCMAALEYLNYLIEESPRIRGQFANRHHELIGLAKAAMKRLERIKINQTEILSHLDLDPEMPDNDIESIVEAIEAKGSKALVSHNGIPRGIRILP